MMLGAHFYYDSVLVMLYLLISGDDWGGTSLINKYDGASEWRAFKTNNNEIIATNTRYRMIYYDLLD